MKLVNAMQKPDLPGTLLFQPACLFSLPHSVEVSDSLSVNGSGVGGGSHSIKAALGEYFERRHFYREVFSVKSGFLNESLTVTEVDSFIGALTQTASRPVSVEEIEKHQFSLTKVVRTSDFSVCFIPTMFISLSPYGLEKDNFLYPLRDTCGCSFHWRLDFAILGSVKEYLERQFLVRFWLTKQCRSLISPDQVRSLLAGRNVKYLYDALVNSGEVSVFDISDIRFPGVCVLVVYGQKKTSHHVKYCAGMSYAGEAAEALEKSLLELWQTYRFMDLFKAIEADEEKVEDAYLRYFLSCNNYKIYEEVTGDVAIVDDSEKTPLSEFSLEVFLSVLKNIDISGYFYVKCSTVNGINCAFSKYVSPDLFLHMNNSKNINLNNKYSKGFESSILSLRLERMVPFP
ncbi:YcaO-like family protein [Pseudomonas sp. ICBG1301]|uniref:YcaO-like family protein n=1 Tax=Pseudomonas sp. ICBG1301 TaxID=2795987 RepID=UPI00196276BD|nr:YcaO-like family protein [Pseudomonas sp. ICBG1301]MBM9484929.1 YcaO-like family protein [Pseudomonas sp. ICBG1301]